MGASCVLAHGWVWGSPVTKVGSPGDSGQGRDSPSPLSLGNTCPSSSLQHGRKPGLLTRSCVACPLLLRGVGWGRRWLSLAAAETPLMGIVLPQEGLDTSMLFIHLSTTNR